MHKMVELPLTICKRKQTSNDNQEVDCHWKTGLFCSATCGNKLTISTSSDVQEAVIVAQCVEKEGDVAFSPSPILKSKRLANTHLFAMGKLL